MNQISSNNQLSHRLRSRDPQTPQSHTHSGRSLYVLGLHRAIWPFGEVIQESLGGFSLEAAGEWEACRRGDLAELVRHLVPTSRLALGSVSMGPSTLGVLRWEFRRARGTSAWEVKHRWGRPLPTRLEISALSKGHPTISNPRESPHSLPG